MTAAHPRALLAACALAAAADAAASGPDLLTVAHGAVPLRIEAPPEAKVGIEQAIRAIDGAAGVQVLTTKVPSSTVIAIVYALPAATTFERFAVPNVLETPSPSQSFVREVRVFGSAKSATEGFELLASATLAAHRSRGQETELTMQRKPTVRWIRVELSGAIDPKQAEGWLEFSELIGQGRQEPAPLDAGFGGNWQGRGLALKLKQDGAVVSGCYDRSGALEGTVSGNVLRATGKEGKVGSAFVAVRSGDGKELFTLRSSNGAPFALYVGGGAQKSAATCPDPAPPALGCGSVVHGIQFDFDSARLRPDSAAVLDALQRGLAAAKSGKVVIEGHTSSEGEAAYNQRLSEERASAVVEALVRRGIAPARLAATGIGETRPIAPNDDESGRELNRRVEIHCS